MGMTTSHGQEQRGSCTQTSKITVEVHNVSGDAILCEDLDGTEKVHTVVDMVSRTTKSSSDWVIMLVFDNRVCKHGESLAEIAGKAHSVHFTLVTTQQKPLPNGSWRLYEEKIYDDGRGCGGISRDSGTLRI